MIEAEDIEITLRINSDEITVSTANRHTKEELSYAKGTDLSFLVSLLSNRESRYLMDIIKSKGLDKEVFG